ncbi:hypothetical protein PROVALCAL_00273 [Providencia alcalifaciens DSM 30120]|uniref:Uncharacterized protein n=1 Tax=Providencia alcalifaciens DSM 30120 TaxID=520999 RepID=B6XAC5_9GAMM|nr:hypothetical protein PROVALCAL_00273 [Providencia alcalifaciens DSM 30120]
MLIYLKAKVIKHSSPYDIEIKTLKVTLKTLILELNILLY